MQIFSEKLNKQNKLKRFAGYVTRKMREVIDVEGVNALDVELSRVDCLKNGDIYTRRDLSEKLDEIAACADIVELRKYETGEIRIHNANYCHNPVVCPVCADRVSKRRRALFADPLKKAVEKFGVDLNSEKWKTDYPKKYTGVYMATATIKDGPNLRERIDTLLDAVKRMRKMGQKRAAGRSRGEWSKVRAGISNVEIKIGKGSGSWHVHSHFLLFTDSPIDIRIPENEYSIIKEDGKKIDVSKFNYEWYTATHGEGINFDVRPVEFQEFVNNRKCDSFADSVSAQAQEVLKYSTLLSDKKGVNILSAAQYVELIQRRGSRRLFNALGLLRCDKRNPESLISISERELQRLEYVESMDSKCYEIFASSWQVRKYGAVYKMDRAVFPDSDGKNSNYKQVRRLSYMAQTAMYQGEYRKLRNHYFRSRHLFTDKNEYEKMLDECRDTFRDKVALLWEKYHKTGNPPPFLIGFETEGMSGFIERHTKQAA